MSKNIKLYFGDFEGDAKLDVSRKGITIKYGDDLTVFSKMILMLFFFFLLYSVLTDDKDDPFWKTVFMLFIATSMLYYVVKFIAFILGPFGKIFSNPKRIHIANELVYASSSKIDSEEVSKLGIAAKFASLAMAGAMSEQGKKVGRNVYMGAAAIIPGTYSKTSSIITFFHKSGLHGGLITDASSCDKIINSVDQSDLRLVKEYITYLNDAKINPSLSSVEVSNKLKKLEDELAGKTEVCKTGTSAKVRQEAVAACEMLLKRIKLLKILYKQIKNQ